MVADVSALCSRLAAAASYRRSIRLVSPFRGAHTAKASSVSPVRPAGAGTGDVGSQRHEPAAGNACLRAMIMRPARGMTAGRLRRRSGWISMFCGSWQGGCGCGWRPSYRMPVRSAPFPDDCGRPGLAWRDESTGCGRPVRPGAVTPALMSGPASWRGSFRFRCACVLTRAMRPVALMSGVIHRRQPRCQPMAIVTPLPLGWRWEAGGMTHVVNLLPGATCVAASACATSCC